LKRNFIFICIVLSFCTAFSQEVITDRVSDIKVEGNNITSSEFVIVRSGLTVGMKLTSDDVKQAIKDLYSTNFFAQIEIEPYKDQYGVSITIKVQENLRINRIIIKGNKKIKEKEILDSLNTQAGEFFSEYNRFKIKNDIENYYHKKGFLNVELKDSVGNINEENSVNLYYQVKENESVRIKKIEIFGRSRGEEMARGARAPLLGQLPIEPEIAKLCDEGNIERYDGEIVTKLGESLARVLPAAVN